MCPNDIKIFCPIINDNDTNLPEWARKMQMWFHSTKCKVMHIGSNNPATAITCTIVSPKLPVTNTVSKLCMLKKF